MPESLPLEMTDLVVSVRSEPPLVLADIARLSLPQGQMLGISGKSGSGKTTLLHALAGLLRPSSGQIAWGGHDLGLMSEAARDRLRHRAMGQVFQDFHLVPELSARDNVRLPAFFTADPDRAATRRRADALLAEMGVPDPLRPARLLSRGEQQRVAIARALLARPSVILADEPTASLDAEAGAIVGALLVEAARASGASLVVVSHDPALLARFSIVRRMENGVLLP